MSPLVMRMEVLLLVLVLLLLLVLLMLVLMLLLSLLYVSSAIVITLNSCYCCYCIRIELFNWLIAQRENRNLSVEREKLMTALADRDWLEWSVQKSNWESQYQRLLEYGETHGDYNVPVSYEGSYVQRSI